MIRFKADADLNDVIVGGCRRREPSIDFLSANDANLEPEVLACQRTRADWGRLGGRGVEEPVARAATTVLRELSPNSKTVIGPNKELSTWRFFCC